MKFASTLALAAALVSSTAALAQKKGKEAQQPAAYSYKLEKPFREAAGPVQAALKAQDAAGAAAKIDALDAVATNPDEKYVAAQLRLSLATLTKDQAMQARAVNGMIASGSGAASVDLPKLHYYAGNFAYLANDPANAVRHLNEAVRLGNTAPDTYLLLAEANFKGNTVPAGLAAVEKAIASQPAGTKAPETWYARAASAAYKAKLNAEAAKWTRLQVQAYPTVENWRSALIIYRDAQKLDPQVNLDLYRLMRATTALTGERDVFEYANDASDRGLPGEAKLVIDEAFTTGKAPRTSKPLLELLSLANGKVASDRASLAASEKQAASAATGRVAAATADAYLGYGDDAKAIALYRIALQKGGVDVNQVNTRLGIALARTGQKDAAKQAFAQVTGPRAELASFWTLYLDQRA